MYLSCYMSAVDNLSTKKKTFKLKKPIHRSDNILVKYSGWLLSKNVV